MSPKAHVLQQAYFKDIKIKTEWYIKVLIIFSNTTDHYDKVSQQLKW